MQRKIAIEQVRLGMYVSKLDGSWLEHSLWRTRFLVREQAQIDKLKSSGVKQLWIDTDQGDDVASDAASEAPAPAAPPVPPQPVTAAGPAPDAPANPEAARVSGLQDAARVRDMAVEQVRRVFGDARLGRALDVDGCRELVQEVIDSATRHHGALVNLLRLKPADQYRELHAVSVCALMISLARDMGLDVEQSREAGLAGLLHDVGMELLPQDMLLQRTPLNEDQLKIVRTHVEVGHALLLEQPDLPSAVLDACMHHHERLDGEGYPQSLPASAIGRMARMAAVCDVYDALTSNRPHRRGISPAEAIAQMAVMSSRFDSAIFGAFTRALGLYPVGSLVRLGSDRLAVVLRNPPGSPCSPEVRVILCMRTRERVSPVRLDLGQPDCDDFIVGRESPSDWPMIDVDALWSNGLSKRMLAAPADNAVRTALETAK